MSTDLHIHLLPGIDDGCKTPQESIELFHECTSHGIDQIAATPHYYSLEPVNIFLEKRKAAVARMTEEMEKNGYEVIQKENSLYIYMGNRVGGWIALGAEVAFRKDITRTDDFDKLCMGNSDYMLIEMPSRKWWGSELQELCEMENRCGVKPVLAHIERYAKYQTKDMLDDLYNSSVVVQSNAERFLSPTKQHAAYSDAKSGKIQIIASDAHDMKSRMQNLPQLYKNKKAQKKLKPLFNYADMMFKEMI